MIENGVTEGSFFYYYYNKFIFFLVQEFLTRLYTN